MKYKKEALSTDKHVVLQTVSIDHVTRALERASTYQKHSTHNQNQSSQKIE